MGLAKPILWNRNFVRCCISYFFLNFSYQMLMPIIPIYLIETLGIESGRAGVILASYTAGVLLVRPFSGYLVDCFSRKKLFLASFFLYAFMFMGYWVAAVPIAIIFVRFAQGSFMGVASVSSNTIAIDVIPSQRRSEGMGFYGMSINLAMASSQVVAVFLYEWVGFNGLIGAALFFSLVGGYSVTQIAIKPRESKSRPPFSLDRFILLKAWPAALTFILLEAPYGMLTSFAVIYGKELGVANPSGFFITMASGILVARIISGKLVDRGKIHPLSIGAITTLTLSIIFFALIKSSELFYLSGLLVGLSYGICVPAFQTLFVNVASPSMRGTATSTYLSSYDVGSGLGMLIAGAVAQTHGLSEAYLVGAAMTFVSLILYIVLVRASYDKNKIEGQ